MWRRLLRSSQHDTELAETLGELNRDTARLLIYTVAGVWAAWQLYIGVTYAGRLGAATLPALGVALATAAAALRLLPRGRVPALALWLAGLGGGIILNLSVIEQGEYAFLLALLPLLATLTLGAAGGCAALAGLTGLLPWLMARPPGAGWPAEYGVYIVGGGALLALLGWLSTRPLQTVAEWSLHSYRQANAKAEEAMAHRAELEQIREDLVHANRELARMSDRMRALNQVAEEARRIKEEFVANVSHELRTPLNMIIGFCEVITQSPGIYGGRLPPKLLADIAAIQRNGQHLVGLVNDVLDLSQIEAGRMALSKRWTVLQEIIAAAATAVQPLYESKRLYLRLEAPAEPIRLFCDDLRIRQVVLNLLSNAGRFTEAGGVTLTLGAADGRAVVRMADTGPGIPAADLERLFEPFQQLDAAVRGRYGGSGLGLTISRRFVEMHAGKMWAESPARPGDDCNEGGPGAAFTFSLPLEPPSLAPLPTAADRWISDYTVREARTRPSKAPRPQAQPRYVLLDPDESLPRWLGRYMSDSEIVTVGDPDAAVQELTRSPAQALIVNTATDTVAPPAARLPFGTPLLACRIPGAAETTRRLGVVDYLIKPISREALLAAVTALGDNVRDVLVADDEPEALQLFTRMLASAGRPYRVLRASNGRQALDLLRERRPDLLLLDLIMPEMDGFQVLEAKYDDPRIREIPVIVISSRDPLGAPIVSEELRMTRSGGLSLRDLVACIQAVSAVLAPEGERGRLRPLSPADDVAAAGQAPVAPAAPAVN
jgi:signal transduction histidine kinase